MQYWNELKFVNYLLKTLFNTRIYVLLINNSSELWNVNVAHIKRTKDKLCGGTEIYTWMITEIRKFNEPQTTFLQINYI